MDSKPRNQSVEVPVNRSFHHDLSHTHVTTLDFFRLQPIMCQECIPGGSYDFDLRAIVSSAPLATQVYGGCHLDIHAFFVPNRIVYNDWNNYFAGASRNESTSFTLPYVTAYNLSATCGVAGGGFTPAPGYENEFKEIRRVFGSLGYPTFSVNRGTSASNMRYSALQARAYQKIWWDYYRDSVNIPESSANSYLSLTGGAVTSSALTTLFTPRYRTFKKDYVSTLLANPQLSSAGSALVQTSIGSSVVTPEGSANITPAYNSTLGVNLAINYTSATETTRNQLISSVNAQALRGAMAMQRYLERLNVTGTRPMERLLALLGAKPSPERLDMAEFIGAKTIRINIDGLVNSGSNEQVLSGTIDNNSYNAWGIGNDGGVDGTFYGQGYQTGHASGSGQTDKLHYTATEHGHIIVIASLIPEYINPNTIERQFIRGLSTPNSDKFDFFTPDMDGLGYQETLLSEVATPSPYDISQVDGTEWQDNFNPFNVVGYEPKYEDYRRQPNKISGDFQETESATAMRYLAYTLSFPEIFNVRDVKAGLNLTTSSFAYRAMFDKHFQINSPDLDHFIAYISIVNDARLPVTNNQLPTELSDLSNSNLLDVSNGGVRL